MEQIGCAARGHEGGRGWVRVTPDIRQHHVSLHGRRIAAIARARSTLVPLLVPERKHVTGHSVTRISHGSRHVSLVYGVR